MYMVDIHYACMPVSVRYNTAVHLKLMHVYIVSLVYRYIIVVGWDRKISLFPVSKETYELYVHYHTHTFRHFCVTSI